MMTDGKIISCAAAESMERQRSRTNDSLRGCRCRRRCCAGPACTAFLIGLQGSRTARLFLPLPLPPRMLRWPRPTPGAAPDAAAICSLAPQSPAGPQSALTNCLFLPCCRLLPTASTIKKRK